jgi:hypothetical protein
LSIESELNAAPSDAEPGVPYGEHEPMPSPPEPERKKIYEGASDSDAVRAASEDLQALRAENKIPVAEAEAIDRSCRWLGGDKVGEKLDPKYVLTPEKASDDLKAVREADAEAVKQELTAQDVDAVRDAYNQAQQPPQPEPAQTAEAQPQQPADGVDPEIAQALQNPKIRAALEAEVSAAEQARVAYQQGALNAARISAPSMLSQWPELAQLSAEQLPHALAAIKAVDPAKATAIETQFNRTSQLWQAARQAEAAQQQIQAQQVKAWAAEQDKIFEREVASKETPARMQEITNNVVELAQEYGVSKDELIAAWQSQPILKSAAFQRMMVDAAKYRMAQKAVPEKISRPVPPVQRPGTSQPRDDGDVSGAMRAFNANPSPQSAAKLLMARRAANRR